MATCFTRFELSIQSAFHQSLTVLVCYRSCADIEPSESQHSVFALPRSSNVTESHFLYVLGLGLFRGLSPPTGTLSRVLRAKGLKHGRKRQSTVPRVLSRGFHLTALGIPVLSPILRESQLLLIPLLNEMLQLRR
jgi:hypothetical protein